MEMIGPLMAQWCGASGRHGSVCGPQRKSQIHSRYRKWPNRC